MGDHVRTCSCAQSAVKSGARDSSLGAAEQGAERRCKAVDQERETQRYTLLITCDTTMDDNNNNLVTYIDCENDPVGLKDAQIIIYVRTYIRMYNIGTFPYI